MLLKRIQTQEVDREVSKVPPFRSICGKRHQVDGRQLLFWLLLLFYQPNPTGTASRVIVTSHQTWKNKARCSHTRGTVPFLIPILKQGACHE